MRRRWRTHRLEDGSSVRVSILEAGHGPPLLLFAAPLILARSYVRLARALSARFHVQVVEAPGSGSSERLRVPWTSERCSRWAVELFDALKLRDATVIGHSNSGEIALAVAHARPQKVRALIVADPVGIFPGRGVWRLALARLCDGLLEPIFSLRAIWHVVSNAIRHPKNVLAQIRYAERADLRAALRRVPVPLVATWGFLDLTSPFWRAKALARSWPALTRFIAGPGSHDWLITRPRRFARLVEGTALIARRPPL